MQRRGSEAEAALRRALAIDPANVFAMVRLAVLRLLRAGDAKGALAALLGEGAEVQVERLEVLRFERRYDEALRLLGPMADSVFPDAGAAGKAFWSGRLLFAAGQMSEALPLLRRAATELEAQVRALPAGYMRNESLWTAWAKCEAMLGNEAQALKIAAESLARVPIERDAIDGAGRLAAAAEIYGLLGRLDLLLPALKRVRELPGADRLISASTLRLDPVWDKVRSDPGFQAEMERFAEFDKR
jgi:tetratricopeptide (TPR) repeat protein